VYASIWTIFLSFGSIIEDDTLVICFRGGFYLKVQPYKPNKSDREVRQKEDFAPKLIEGYNRIYAGNLPWDITEDDIKKFFSDCKISSIRFGTDKETGDFKGYAHVDFSDGTSLAVALKLDQKVIKGRPVRIRCAVPKKDNQKVNDNGKLDPSKNKIRTCYECGTPGHLSSSCPNKKDSEMISDEKKINVDSATGSSKKRRTCYECGTPGHLSSACPNKRTDSIPNNREPDDDAKPGPTIVPEEKKGGDESNVAPSKKCYECGTPGHLSSACPNKRAAYSVSDNREPDDEAKAAPATVPEENNAVDGSNLAPSKKRRKCYECGISGHLSSACPNKKAAEVCFEEKPEDVLKTVPSVVADEMKASEDTKPAPAKKKKRRTCYECGIAGHLSSECPNKAAAQY
jgi:squamous cell carcinoma antigen recognized by T-cells 3